MSKKEPWNKLSFDEAKEKALTLNPDLEILKVTRDSKNNLKFKIVCPYCGHEKKTFMTMAHIKENKLACKECMKVNIGKKNSIPKEGKSFYENDVYGRVRFWDLSKNKISPKEVSKASGKMCWFVCENGHSFSKIISDVNKGGWCQHCVNKQIESKMATALKQVFKNEFKYTIWEHDIGFKGDRGGVSSYDIYVPELNLLIECQSVYHDSYEQIQLDRRKRVFAKNKGYNFIAIDHRDFEPLNAIKLFFPQLTSLPQYVDYNKDTTSGWDCVEAQLLLNNSDLTQTEIIERVGASPDSFYSKVYKGGLLVPDSKRVKKPIVQISLEGKLVRRYNSARECSLNYGYNAPDICVCCKNINRTHYGFIWMYESDYELNKDEHGDIEIKKDYLNALSKCTAKKIVQIDKLGKYVSEYESIAKASELTGFIKSNISTCCSKKTKTSNGYIWMYKDEYEKSKDEFGFVKVDVERKDQTKKIVVISPDMGITEYKSARLAEKYIPYNFSQISYKCRNKMNKEDTLAIMLHEDYLDLIKNDILSVENIDRYKVNKYKKVQ